MPKPDEAGRITLIGEPFKARSGNDPVEVGVYELEGYGRRIIPTSRNREGELLKPRASNCLHGQPITPNPRFVAYGDKAGYAQVCRVCEYEADVKTRPNG